MTFSFRHAAALAACLILSHPAAANERDLLTHATRFVHALQQQRFDEAASMFKPSGQDAPARTATWLKRISTRIGGFETMRKVVSLPDGKTLKLQVPPVTAPAVGSAGYYQLTYTATAADGQAVFYVLALEGGASPQRVLWFEVYFPVPDAASMKRAQQALRDM